MAKWEQMVTEDIRQEISYDWSNKNAVSLLREMFTNFYFYVLVRWHAHLWGKNILTAALLQFCFIAVLLPKSLLIYN